MVCQLSILIEALHTRRGPSPLPAHPVRHGVTRNRSAADSFCNSISQASGPASLPRSTCPLHPAVLGKTLTSTSLRILSVSRMKTREMVTRDKNGLFSSSRRSQHRQARSFRLLPGGYVIPMFQLYCRKDSVHVTPLELCRSGS